MPAKLARHGRKGWQTTKIQEPAQRCGISLDPNEVFRYCFIRLDLPGEQPQIGLHVGIEDRERFRRLALLDLEVAVSNVHL